MKKTVLMATALAAASGFAENLYWDKVQEQSADARLDWNTPSSWRIGGNSQWDDVSQTVPVRGEDTAVFRGVNAFVKIDKSTEQPATQIWCDSNKYDGDPSFVDILMTPGASLHYAFTELVPRCGISFAGGELNADEGSELYLNAIGKLSFSAMTVRNLKVLAMRHDCEVKIHNVVGQDLTVNLATWNDQDNDRNLLAIDGNTTVDNFVLGGHYYNSKVSISNATFSTFSLSRTEETRYQEGTVLSNHFHVVNSDLGTFYFGNNRKNEWNFHQLPDYVYDFTEGTHVAFSAWDPIWFSAKGNVLRFAGEDTYATNVTVQVNSNDTRLEIVDGAFVESRSFRLGRGATNVTGRISGEGTRWLIQPNDMEFESAIAVGDLHDGRSGTGNTLTIENGARVDISAARSFKNNELKRNLGGFLVGAETGDNSNTVYITSGAVVTNDFWLCVGGGWMNNNGKGGSFNKVVVDNATLANAASFYNDGEVYDTTFFLGYQTGYSNSLEVVNGSYFRTRGTTTLGGAETSGGSSILVDNSYADFGNKIMANRKNYTYGGHVITVGGTNGTIKAGCLCIDAGNTDITNGGFDLVFRLEKGRRSIPDAMFDFSGSWYDGNGSKDPFWGTVLNDANPPVRLRFEIGDKWAHSGKDNSVVLISHGCESGQYGNKGRWSEAGLRKLYELYKDDPSLKGCTLSFVDSQEGQRPAQLILTAGGSTGLVIVVK